MANVAFGVRQTADGIGTTDVDIRKMLAHKWVNKGVVGGLSVKGSTGLTYIVGAGMAICSKGAETALQSRILTAVKHPPLQLIPLLCLELTLYISPLTTKARETAIT